MATYEQEKTFVEGTKQPEVREVCEIVRFKTSTELKSHYPDCIDPQRLVERFPDWKWPTNENANRIVYEVRLRSAKKNITLEDRDGMEKRCLLIHHRQLHSDFVLLKNRVLNVVVADFEPGIAWPEDIERLAYMHDMGFVQGVFVRRTDKHTPISFAKHVNTLGTGETQQLLNPQHLTSALPISNVGSSFFLEYFVFDPTLGIVRVKHYRLGTKTETKPNEWLQYRALLEKTLRMPVIHMLDFQSLCCHCGKRASHDVTRGGRIYCNRLCMPKKERDTYIRETESDPAAQIAWCDKQESANPAAQAVDFTPIVHVIDLEESHHGANQHKRND